MHLGDDEEEGANQPMLNEYAFREPSNTAETKTEIIAVETETLTDAFINLQVEERESKVEDTTITIGESKEDDGAGGTEGRELTNAELLAMIGAEPRPVQHYECVLCHQQCMGFGNNPHPLASLPAECCNSCNRNRVIPARLGYYQ